jgi:hypothetical protein
LALVQVQPMVQLFPMLRVPVAAEPGVPQVVMEVIIQPFLNGLLMRAVQVALL